ncbi:MAG TPA: hypothetical protein VGR15_03485, partial [Bacteroidota bacterium]|nr:hypothetical protein [Bacteroidota bacterium]
MCRRYSFLRILRIAPFCPVRFLDALLLLTLLLSSCKENTTTVEQGDQHAVLSIDKAARELNIRHVDYGVYTVSNNDAFIIGSQDIETIQIGRIRGGQFVLSDSLTPAYAGTSGRFTVVFASAQVVDTRYLDDTVSIRYLLTGDTRIEVDTSVAMYKFPYSSTSIFLAFDSIMDPSNCIDHIQDFDIAGTGLFIHPTGPCGLFHYDLGSKELKTLVNYPGGNFIAYDSIFVFFEVSGISIQRFNIRKDTVDLIFDLRRLEYTNIEGMAASNRMLYVHFSSWRTENRYLSRFSFDGAFIDSITYPRETYFMTIHNNVLYAISFTADYLHPNLSRFDLTSRTFLQERMYP